jgi:hypothetical protein
MKSFTAIRFEYQGGHATDIGNQLNLDTLGNQRPHGDCATLTSMFLNVATNDLHIAKLKKVDWEPDQEKIFVPGGGRIVDPDRGTGNMDNGRHWMFKDHHWVEKTGSKAYDVLFNKDYASSNALRAVSRLIPSTTRGALGKALKDKTPVNLLEVPNNTYLESEDNIFHIDNQFYCLIPNAPNQKDQYVPHSRLKHDPRAVQPTNCRKP